MMSLINRVPAGASSKQIIHYAQLVKSGEQNYIILILPSTISSFLWFVKINVCVKGRFVKFSIDGSENREEYDLKKVTVPVAVFYTAQDALSNEDDVSRLIKELPNVKVQKKIEQMSNNLDMLYANDVEKLVYVDVIRALYTMQKPFQN